MAFVDRDRARIEAAGRPTLADAQAIALRDAVTVKLIRVFRVGTAAMHHRPKKMPEAAHHDLARADLERLFAVRS